MVANLPFLMNEILFLRKGQQTELQNRECTQEQYFQWTLRESPLILDHTAICERSKLLHLYRSFLTVFRVLPLPTLERKKKQLK